MPKEYVRVAKVDEIEPGTARVFRFDEVNIALCRVEDKFYAIEDLCTHDDGPLGEGRLDGTAIECPRHGAKFDVTTGKVLSMPAAYPVTTFPTKVEEGEVFVELEKD